MVTTDLPAGPLRSCPVRLGRAFPEGGERDPPTLTRNRLEKQIEANQRYGETRATRA